VKVSYKIMNVNSLNKKSSMNTIYLKPKTQLLINEHEMYFNGLLKTLKLNKMVQKIVT
jgi:hypothetical protein